MDDLALGIDIGGTKVAAALVDHTGAVAARERGPVAPESNETGLDSIFTIADRLLAGHQYARARLIGIGAGAPGGIDWRHGIIRGAANLAWRDLPLAAALRERYGVPTLLDNDVNVAAWGEAVFGGADKSTDQSPIQHLVFITVGTGIGSGLIESGRIVRGRRGAGEIGHIPLIENGPRCKCGMAGCLEAVASGPAFAAAAREIANRGEAPRLLELAGGRLDAIDTRLVIRAAQGGDIGARHALDREGYYLALAVLIAGRMLDPEVVVIGGGVAEAGQPLFAALWRNLERLRPGGPIPSTYAIPTRLGPDAGAIGAAALVLHPEPGFAAAGLVP